MHPQLNKVLSIALGLCLMGLSALVSAEQRVALVIGNANYDSQKPLSNPTNDAKDIAALLSSLGFNNRQVVPLLNLKRKAMNSAVQDFLNQAEGADLAVVYYSGHGMQTAGESFLIPTDAQIQSERDVRSEGIRLSEMMDDLEAHHIKRTLIVLDACRDNPFRTRTKSASKGLAPPKEMSGGFLVAFATADGQTADDGSGRNGTYTAELLRHLGQPGQSLRDQVEDTQLAVEQRSKNAQHPKVYGDTVKFRDVYLSGAGRSASAGNRVASLSPDVVNTGPASQGSAPDPAEAAYWAEVAKSQSEADLKAYLQTYPSGAYAHKARELLDQQVQVQRQREQNQEEQAWAKAQQADDYQEYANFIGAYPNSRYAPLAKLKQSKTQEAWQDKLILGSWNLKQVSNNITYSGTFKVTEKVSPGNYAGVIEMQ